jgi:DNA-binding MarR family transcriptional regulator
MEEAGLIARERMPHDQRRVSISMTPRSRQMAHELVPQVEARYAALEQELGVKAMQDVYDALDALLARAPAVGPD